MKKYTKRQVIKIIYTRKMILIYKLNVVKPVDKIVDKYF
jgi:hypothetical protein